MEGSLIGAYHIVRKLGEGGMGTVYLAEHALLGRTAAVKVLLPMYSANAEIVGRFFNEARAVTRVSDPGIVQLFDFGYHTDGSAYLVMELLDGESLDARLRRVGKLSPIEAVRLMRQCASSLATAHARGIIHRDLKPENLFVIGDPAVTGGERIKILDFGVAKLSGDGLAVSKTRTGMLVGTPIYMSPEQCRGAADVDARSDVYSLGCVLFALLAGRPPFPYDNSGELIAAHLRERPPSLAGEVPPEVDAVVQACLAKSPNDRYRSMPALVEALDRLASQLWYEAPIRTPSPLGMSAPPAVTTLRGATGETQPIHAPRRGRRVAVIAGVAALCVVGAIVIVSATRSPAATTANNAPIAAPSASSVSPASATPSPPDASIATNVAAMSDASIAAALPTDAAVSLDITSHPAPVAPTQPATASPKHDATVPPTHDSVTHEAPKRPHPHAPPARSHSVPEEDHAKTDGSGSAVIDRGD